MNKTIEAVRKRERESYILKKNNVENKGIVLNEKVKKSLKQILKYKSMRIGYLADAKEKQKIKRIKLLQDSLSFL